MDIFNALMAGFATAITPVNLLWALVGCALGTAVGVLPGIGPALTVAMLLSRLVKVRDWDAVEGATEPVILPDAPGLSTR